MRAGEAGKISLLQPKYGVTSFCPASISDTDEATHVFLRSVKQAKRADRGARIIGAYLEGPFLAEETKGAHDAAKLRNPTHENYCCLVGEYEDIVSRITLAPEKAGGLELTRELSDKGIVVSIGHSIASAEETQRAIENGITGNTHTCNGMRLMHHREPGVLGISLTDDRMWVEFIADMIHISAIIVKLIYRAKGVEKCYYCTDSIEATGLSDGNYKLGTEDITVKNSIARLTYGDSLAGSTLTMDAGLKNLVQKAGIPIEDALRMSSYNQADVIGRKDIGRIESGACADFVLLDKDLNVVATYVRGVCEYRK